MDWGGGRDEGISRDFLTKSRPERRLTVDRHRLVARRWLSEKLKNSLYNRPKSTSATTP
jgi:hypothetical protein